MVELHPPLLAPAPSPVRGDRRPISPRALDAILAAAINLLGAIDGVAASAEPLATIAHRLIGNDALRLRRELHRAGIVLPEPRR